MERFESRSIKTRLKRKLLHKLKPLIKKVKDQTEYAGKCKARICNISKQPPKHLVDDKVF